MVVGAYSSNMILALVSPDGVATCTCCAWQWKVPGKPLRKGKGKFQAVRELTLAERLKLLEEQVLAHLRDQHDRLMLTRHELATGGEFPKVMYEGRRPSRR